MGHITLCALFPLPLFPCYITCSSADSGGHYIIARLLPQQLSQPAFEPQAGRHHSVCEFNALLLLLAGSLPASCCCIANVTLLSRVTLIRKLQSTSDLDHYHARDLPCLRVKSRDDHISDRRGYIYIIFIYIYRFTAEFWKSVSIWRSYRQNNK